MPRTTSAPGSAGTTTSSTRRPAIPTSSTSAAPTRTARTSRTSAGWCSRPTPASARTDMTMDGTDIYHPNGLHPDQHALVTNPDNPFQFFEVNDGGLMRSSGEFADVSAWCDDPARPGRARTQPLPAAAVPRAHQAGGHEQGLSTLQFQSLSVSPFNVERAPGRHAGQRHLADAGQPGEVDEHHDRRRRPVGLRRRRTRTSASTPSSTPRPT